MKVVSVGRAPGMCLRTLVLLASGVVGCAVYDQSANERAPLDGQAGSDSAGAGAGGTNGGSSPGQSGSATQGGSGSAGSSAGTSAAGTGTAAGTGGTSTNGGAGAGGSPAVAGTSAQGGEGDGGEPAVPTPVELATGKTATASTSEAAHLPSAGNDGSHTTRWSASGATLPQWWQVDLGAAHDLENITVRWEFGNVEYTYAIEVSTNGSSFTQAVVVSALGSPPTSQFPAGTKARYVRIKITEIAPTNWASIYEVTVMGT